MPWLLSSPIPTAGFLAWPSIRDHRLLACSEAAGSLWLNETVAPISGWAKNHGAQSVQRDQVHLLDLPSRPWSSAWTHTSGSSHQCLDLGTKAVATPSALLLRMHPDRIHVRRFDHAAEQPPISRAAGRQATPQLQVAGMWRDPRIVLCKRIAVVAGPRIVLWTAPPCPHVPG